MDAQTAKIEVIQIENPEAKNLIFGQAHFIKTVEALHDALATSVPGIKFGLAFCEASGSRLIRTTGTSVNMIDLAITSAKSVGCGHSFFIFLENAFPINVLNAIKLTPEVVRIFCATANPLQVIVGETGQGRGVLGVVDGGAPLGIENEGDVDQRKALLKALGYKP